MPEIVSDQSFLSHRSYSELLSTNIANDTSLALKDDGRIGKQGLGSRIKDLFSSDKTISTNNQKIIRQLEISLIAKGCTRELANTLLSQVKNNQALTDGSRKIQGSDIRQVQELAKNVGKLEIASPKIGTTLISFTQSQSSSSALPKLPAASGALFAFVAAGKEFVQITTDPIATKMLTQNLVREMTSGMTLDSITAMIDGMSEDGFLDLVAHIKGGLILSSEEYNPTTLSSMTDTFVSEVRSSLEDMRSLLSGDRTTPRPFDPNAQSTIRQKNVADTLRNIQSPVLQVASAIGLKTLNIADLKVSFAQYLEKYKFPVESTFFRGSTPIESSIRLSVVHGLEGLDVSKIAEDTFGDLKTTLFSLLNNPDTPKRIRDEIIRSTNIEMRPLADSYTEPYYQEDFMQAYDILEASRKVGSTITPTQLAAAQSLIAQLSEENIREASLTGLLKSTSPELMKLRADYVEKALAGIQSELAKNPTQEASFLQTVRDLYENLSPEIDKCDVSDELKRKTASEFLSAIALGAGGIITSNTAATGVQPTYFEKLLSTQFLFSLGGNSPAANAFKNYLLGRQVF